MFTIRKATRKKAKARIGIAGASGSGKTYSSLLIAFGLADESNPKVGVIDTENASAELYAPEFEKYGGYYVITLTPPFDPLQYIEAMKAFEKENFDVIIIDSLSHAWAGTGGLLEQHTKLIESGQTNFSAWKGITPKHNKLMESIILSPAHVISTFRAKSAYLVDNSEGKTKIIKVGTTPIQREGIEYEFTIFMELNPDHTAKVTKDRTGLFDQKLFIPKIETGIKVKKYLESGITLEEELIMVLRQAKTLDELKALWEKRVSFEIISLKEEQRQKIIECKNEMKKKLTKNISFDNKVLPLSGKKTESLINKEELFEKI